MALQSISDTAPSTAETAEAEASERADDDNANSPYDSEASKRRMWTHYAMSATSHLTGLPIKWNQESTGQNAETWHDAMHDELVKLIDVRDNMEFEHISAKPAHKTATYFNPQCFEKFKNGKWTERVRGTVGGDRIKAAGPVSSSTAALEDVKLLWNSVLSTPGAKFMTVDLDDFFLMTGPLEEPEYMWIKLKDIPAKSMAHFNVMKFAVGDKVLVKIKGGMYGLPQAAKLASDHLEQQVLIPNGFVECPHTRSCFRHSNGLLFAKIVDDFGIKYVDENNVRALLKAFDKHYTYKVDWSGTKFIGFTLEWSYTTPIRRLAVSMPGYVEKLVIRFEHILDPILRVHSAGGYTAPVYGAKAQAVAETIIDDSPALADEVIKMLQELIGAALFYVRCVDPIVLNRITELASAQSKGTQSVLEGAIHMLTYLRTYPNAHLIYRASDMVLHAHSDGSGHGADARVAGFFFLGSQYDPKAPATIANGAIQVVCQKMKIVPASVAETEYAALFTNGQTAAALRNTLADFGHPQGPTPIQGDNTCANGIANDTVKQKRSKAMDTRLHWIRDRVRQGQFHIYWRPGNLNLADFFTKNHSVAHTRLMRPIYVTDGTPTVTVDTVRVRHKARNSLAKAAIPRSQ